MKFKVLNLIVNSFTESIYPSCVSYNRTNVLKKNINDYVQFIIKPKNQIRQNNLYITNAFNNKSGERVYDKITKFTKFKINYVFATVIMWLNTNLFF